MIGGATRDFRLVPAAISVWAVVLVGLRCGWQVAVLCALVALAVAATVLLRWRWHRASAGVLAACALAAAAAGGLGLRLWQVADHPLHAAAEHRAAASIRVEVADRPRPVHTSGYGGRPGGADRVVVPATLRSALVEGTSMDGGGRVVLVAPSDQWGGLLPGQDVTAEGLLVCPDAGELTLAVLRVRGAPSQIGRAPLAQRAAESLRAGLRRVSAVLGPEPAGLLPAIVDGDTSALPQQVTEEFRVAGLTHIVAVSGENLAIVCCAVLLGLRVVGAGPRTSGVGALLALVGFVVLAGPQASVLRAAVMGGVALLALVFGRQRSALPALAVSVIGLLFVDPTLGADAGFALSVLATGALVVLAPIWSAALHDRGVPAGIAESLATALAAHLVTAPLIAALSAKVSLVAVVANLLAEPAVVPATVLGVVAAALAPVHQGAAELVVRVAGPAVRWLIAVARHCAATPGAEVDWPVGLGGGLLLAVVLAAALVLLRSRRLRVLLASALVGAVLVVLPTRVVTPPWPAVGWAAVSCDVGQGDATVLATSQPGRAVLVDTGPEPAAIGACLQRLGVHQVPLVVLTHLHADHIGGLAAVLADRAVGAVATGPLRQPDWAMDQVRRQTSAARVPLVDLVSGQRLEWPGLALEVLGPQRVRPVPGRGALSGTFVNDASLVLRASTAAGRMLLAGDVELAGQTDLLASGTDLRADVLKVPHHGSRYSLPLFLAAVRPRVGVISVGAGNPYGHPSPLLLDMLVRQGTLVARTDRSGDLAVTAGTAGLALVRRGEARAPPHR